MPVRAYCQSVSALVGSPQKKVVWIRSSKRDFKAFPETAQKHIGFALKSAQFGEKHSDAKPLKGFGGANVLEIVEDYDRDTYRAVYTVQFREVVCVLHAFQKKSKSGSATPRHDIDLIKERLRYAKELHEKKLI
jgi:phage-related protein